MLAKGAPCVIASWDLVVRHFRKFITCLYYIAISRNNKTCKYIVWFPKQFNTYMSRNDKQQWCFKMSSRCRYRCRFDVDLVPGTQLNLLKEYRIAGKMMFSHNINEICDNLGKSEVSIRLNTIYPSLYAIHRLWIVWLCLIVQYVTKTAGFLYRRLKSSFYWKMRHFS